MAQQVRPWLMKPENGRAPIECAKADGDQPAEPIRDSGLRAAPKVRMYGCNRNLFASSREEKAWQRLGASMYGQSERPERTLAAGVQIRNLAFARRDIAPGDQGRHQPQCVFGLEVAAKSADTCSW